MTTKDLQKRSEKSQDLKVFRANGNYFVESSEGAILYKVNPSGEPDKFICTCGDYARGVKGDPKFQCKHSSFGWDCIKCGRTSQDSKFGPCFPSLFPIYSRYPALNSGKQEVKMAKKPMSKSQVVSHFAGKFELSKKNSAAILDEVAALAVSETKKVGSFTLPGIGKLVLVKRKARMGRNPATGATIKIAAKTVVKMRIAKAAKEAIVPAKKK
jgi:DNA-binding protein HU-beta